MTFGRKFVSANAAAPADPGGPLLDAMQYVGMVSPPGAYVTGMTSPEPCLGPDNARGLRFAIETDAGPGYGFVFPLFASIWLHGEAAPRPPIPTEMIANRVPGYAGELAGLPG